MISTIIMLAIILALSGSTYMFISGYFTSKTATAFSIVYAYNDTVTIRNDGTTSIDSILVTLDGESVETIFDLNQYLIGYWKFNEGSGSTTKDEIQNLEVNLNGQWTSGKFGSAYQFVGRGWVSTTFPSAIGNGVTYVFWFKLPDTSDISGTFFCVQDVSDRSLEDNLGQTSYGDLGCYGRWTNSGFNVNDDEWHFYAFSKSTTSILCKDNECVNLGDATNNIPNINHIEFNGGCGCGYGNFGQGIIIDEVRIYNRALSAEEIKALYQANGETILDPGQIVTIKPLTDLTPGTHTIKLCTASACRTGYLTIV